MKSRRILIIDNETGAMADIKESLKGEEITVIHFKKFRLEKAKGFTHIILTGGDYWPKRIKFSREIRLLRNPPAPVFCVCLGMQIMAVAFKSSMMHLDSVKKGSNKITIIETDEIFKKVPKTINAFEFHEYGIKKLGKDLVALANSSEGIEAIKHKTLPVWGVQFHPEVKVDNKLQGRKIIKTFLEI